MKRLIVLLGVFACGFVLFAQGELDQGLLRGKTDKAQALYAPNEEMVFTLWLDRVKEVKAGDWFIQWRRTGDDGKIETGKAPVSLTEPVVVKTSLSTPGFVYIFAEVVDAKGVTYKTTSKGRPILFEGGAGVEIEKLQGIPEPNDFNAFHAQMAETLKAVPIQAERRECPSKSGKVYAISIACAGPMPVTGYLTFPEGAEKGAHYPCRLATHGYGFSPFHNATAPASAYSPHEIVLNINAHGMKLPAFGATDAYYKELGEKIKSNGHGYAFDPIQNANREKAYFYGMFLRVKRALQYLKTLPEWNGKDLYASGGSQGGLQTIWAAGCGEGVTHAQSAITWCCDIGGTELKRNRGGWYIHWVSALGYYDAINVAKRIPKTCVTEITRAGLGDYVCPPSGLAILYNNIPGPKKILWVQGSTHGYVPPEPNQKFTLTNIK